MNTQYRDIQHLHLRFGFGAEPERLERLASESRSAWVNALIDDSREVELIPAPQTLSPYEVRMMTGEEKQETMMKQRESIAATNAHWFNLMGYGKGALRERMSLFWHDHFACKSPNASFTYGYLDTIRKNALGNFRTMLFEVSKSPAMLQFLNNQLNRKGSPNENFAREVMELFTLGRGNYTENDIKEAARAFTGWGFGPSGSYTFRARIHDDGIKTVFGKSGRFGGDDILDMLLERPETAQYICQKIYTYFVDEKDLQMERVDELANIFRSGDYEILPVIEYIASSDWFYESRGSKVKSPVDFLAGLSRMFGVTFEDVQGVIRIQKALGQVLLNPPSVAGWDHGRSWIDSNTLMLRMMLPKALFIKGKWDHKAPLPWQLKQLHADVSIDALEASYSSFTDSEVRESLIMCEAPFTYERDLSVIASSLEFQLC